MKKHKIINLSEEIISDIQIKNKSYSFNFSEWVERAYFNEFMSVNSKLIELKNIQNKKKKIKEELEKARQYEKIVKSILNSSEKRWLLNVQIMLGTGSSWTGLFTVFNQMFHKDYTFIEFKRIVELVENETQRKRYKNA